MEPKKPQTFTIKGSSKTVDYIPPFIYAGAEGDGFIITEEGYLRLQKVKDIL